MNTGVRCLAMYNKYGFIRSYIWNTMNGYSKINYSGDFFITFLITVLFHLVPTMNRKTLSSSWHIKLGYNGRKPQIKKFISSLWLLQQRTRLS